MGRTKRRRIRKKNNSQIISLDNNPSVIELNKWMRTKGWENSTSLKLSLFKNTGRGLTSPKNIPLCDSLIEVPYKLMLTYTTLKDFYLNNPILSSPSEELKIHDALSIFLAIERHKGFRSQWKPYIDSLPEDMPLLPCLCSEEEITNVPYELRLPVLDKYNCFQTSWQRSKESINPQWKCECCKIPGHRVLTLNLFTWAYAMVNTRAVYVDPDIVRGLSSDSENNTGFTLSDDPCMALCPYLDMFNHSYKSSTNAALEKVNGKWVYKLINSTATEKYKEIFISYGSHDNEKLLCDYGFFIPNNEFDVVKINFDELLERVKVNERQYQFICQRQLTKDLYVNLDGLSFNLKATLFVILNRDVINWCTNIFSETYTKKDLFLMYCFVKETVRCKIYKCKCEYSNFDNFSNDTSESFKNIVSYIKYRLIFMEKILLSITEFVDTI